MSDTKIIDSPPPRSVHPLLLNICQRFWPQLKTTSPERQVIGVGEVLSTLYAAPFVIAGIIWLIAVTDFAWLQGNWLLLILFGVLIFSFHQLRFFLIVELRENRYGSADGAMTGIPLWAGVLLYGPTMFWLPLLWSLVQFLNEMRHAQSATARWSQWRGISMNLASETLVPLVVFQFYLGIGGQFPFAELSVPTILPALMMFGLYFVLYAIFWMPYLAYHTWAQQALSRSRDIRPILKFFWLAIGLPQLANPFAILAAGIYAQNGMAVFLFMMTGMLMVAYLSRRMSWTTERSRQSSRLLEKLEALGRAIIDAPPDSENISELLEIHLTNMFPAGRLVVWIFPDDVLTQQPMDWEPELDEIWPWLLNHSEGDVFLAGETLPWKEAPGGHNPVVVAPIRDVDEAQTFGGIYLELHTLSQPWNRRALRNLCPAVQALAAQIASALKQAQAYEQTLEFQRVSEELKLAGSIQASLLPNSFPDMDGWQFAVTLAPAGETSGDFFDIITLADGKVGFVIADVLDKGVGPAIYMTLSRTLIRTYATEFDLQPDLVFFATNERILKDTRANLFVTAFFGVLDPAAGTLTYANAGHNPPYFLGSQNGCDPTPLEKTGFPIGIDEDATWERAEITLNPGDVLVLYTDGVPDAQNIDGDFFKQESLVKVVQDHLGESAETLQTSILNAVYDFVGDAPPFDDITLMVLQRDLQEETPAT
jgi:serine phosphatase RsbU (regulator of sigma subunit)